MDFCPNCGSVFMAGAKICSLCGQRIDATADAEPERKDPSTGRLYEVCTRKWFRQGWETFKRYPLGFFEFGVLCLLLAAGLRYLGKEIPYGKFFLDALLAPLYAGIFIVCTKVQQRQFIRLSDFFSALNFYQPLIIFGFLGLLLSKIGYLLPESLILRLLCSLAFLIFMMFNLFTPMLIIDRRLDWIEAMELSYRTVQRRPLPFLGFLLWGFLIAASGFLALVIGSIVTVPVFFGAITAAYADLFGLQSQEY